MYVWESDEVMGKRERRKEGMEGGREIKGNFIIPELSS